MAKTRAETKKEHGKPKVGVPNESPDQIFMDALLKNVIEEVASNAIKVKSGEVKDTQQKDCKNNPLILYCVAVVVVLAVVIVSSLLSEQDNSTKPIDIQLKLDRLFQDFKNQSPRSAKKLRSRVMPYLNHTRSPQPFVLLVAAIQDDELAANCFATRVGKMINSKLLTINASLYLNDTGKKVKQDIDRRLRDAFQEGEFPTAAIIYNLDLLPYSTLDLFYSFCDHDNPLYKDATIIFTVMLPPEYHLMSSTGDDIKKEGMVETYLQEEWSKDEKFDENVIGALLSRISDTIIVMSGESNESLEKLCSSAK